MRRCDDLTMCAKILDNNCLKSTSVRFDGLRALTLWIRIEAMLLTITTTTQKHQITVRVLLVEVTCIELHIEHRIEVDAFHSDSPY